MSSTQNFLCIHTWQQLLSENQQHYSVLYLITLATFPVNFLSFKQEKLMQIILKNFIPMSEKIYHISITEIIFVGF
jgi:hypothetical protein